MLRFYRQPAVPASRLKQLQEAANVRLAASATPSVISKIDSEVAYYVELSVPKLSDTEFSALRWLLSETFEPELFAEKSFIAPPGEDGASQCLVEVGPRLSFTSAFSTNAVSVLSNCGLPVVRVERYRRFRLYSGDAPASAAAGDVFASLVHDRMTEWRLPHPLTTFSTGIKPVPVRHVPVLESGAAALEHANKTQGLSLDAWDVSYLVQLFKEELHRDPTDVELFDFSQSNSEHSRHWFFRGNIVIDGEPLNRTLMQVVQSTLDAHPENSVIAFADNSSAIKGYNVTVVQPVNPLEPGPLHAAKKLRHLLLTAETHNFPTGVAPFPGAETGTGGRIRDSHATGRGSYAIAGTAGYCVGNLLLPGYDLPWESKELVYPSNLATPRQIAIEASNGASDYGNKFGEPVIAGFARSVCLFPSAADRREYIKPIMFTAGIGAIDDDHIVKGEAAVGMVVVKLGGPAYRIGMGGSAASSMMQGDNAAELDFNAVQRGDAEMEQKVNRVIRACCELGATNPIISIHDQGAGGNCNVLKEIVAPAGGRVDIRKVLLGDNTLSVLEIWGAEYQEADALLIKPDSVPMFAALCARERVPVAFVGDVTGDGRMVVQDSADGTVPVDLPLEKVLGKMPQKTFTYERSTFAGTPVRLDTMPSVAECLDRVLRLMSVGSKRFLTNKVDRSVTGLIAQQQCVGPLHTPLADFALVALSHLGVEGVASSIGEQPVKGLANPAAMARMAVAEAITNMAGVRVSGLTEAKCSANWMWAAKLPHEGASLVDAAVAMADFMIATGVAVDGGKDSLSMAARLPSGETVKAPGTLVISLYAPCPDVNNRRSPDLKLQGGSSLILVEARRAAAPAKARIGGSALAQVFGQVGTAEEVPDCEDAAALVALFTAVQKLLDVKGCVLSVHDRSDGGLLVAALEMAFAGNCGLTLSVDGDNALTALFNEEAGVILEVADAHIAAGLAVCAEQDVAARVIGATTADGKVSVSVNGAAVLSSTTDDLRDVWEATSFALERLQSNPACVESEQKSLRGRKQPRYHLTYEPAPTAPAILSLAPASKPCVAVIREEGTNGDREMGAAWFQAGFDVWDVTMSDLAAGRVALDGRFRGVVFPGGFSYADVLDSAKGWAGSIKLNPKLWEQFTAFYEREDTFSLGVCNGCQLMALLGWVPGLRPVAEGGPGLEGAAQPRFIHNVSQRFESRFSTVKVGESPAMMLRGMAGSVLGVWVSHGEGQAHFPDPTILDTVKAKSLVPLYYTNDEGDATEVYPFNPNGSPLGIAGLCSPNGRHLAMMPHPERAHKLWEWAWMPNEWVSSLKESPWMRMFQNAREWCDK